MKNKQTLPVAIVGAGGRMGSLLIDAIRASDRYDLVGLLDGPGESSLHTSVDAGEGRSVEIVDDAVVAFRKTSVIIDFSLPAGTMNALDQACQQQIPMVIGTTGFSAEQSLLIEKAAKTIPLVVASNMSLGINLLKTLVRYIVPRLPDDYDIEIIERHHNKKRDSPSGTASELANLIRQQRERYADQDWKCGRPLSHETRLPGDLVIHPVRGGGIIGEHHVCAIGDSEEITLSHRAFHRRVFVAGALAAASFIVTARPGLYTMENVVSGK